MDIRNFFGSSAKKKTSSSASSSSGVTSAAASKSSPRSLEKRHDDEDKEEDKKGANATQSSSSSSSPRRDSPVKKRKIVVDSDVDAEDDDDGDDEKAVLANVVKEMLPPDDGDDDDDDYFEQAKRKRELARMNNAASGAAKGGAAVNGKKNRRKTASDDDNNDDDDVMMEDEDNHDDCDDDDDDGWPKKKKKTASVAMSTKASPEKKRKITKAVKKATTAISKQATSKKYHPPSSKIANIIPYLAATDLVDPVPYATMDELPTLPNNEPNFSIDTMTPNCLEGLTFVFSGILSTSKTDDTVRKTNAEIALSSPSKSDYYTTRTHYDAGSTFDELSRDSAVDIIKCLGGRVTTAVSGKTDYLIAGNVLEDGRDVQEGSKYKKCISLWSDWKEKHRNEYLSLAGGNDDSDSSDCGPKRKAKKAAKKAMRTNPDTLVEIVRGIHEFYGLIVYLSECKGGRHRKNTTTTTTTSTVAAAASLANEDDDAMDVDIGETITGLTVAATSSISKVAAASNPYKTKTPIANPYTNRAPVANPYANRAPIANPYAKSTSATPVNGNNQLQQSSRPVKSNNNNNVPTHPGSGKELGINSLWADRYAPTSSSEILGNSDSVTKLSKWLSNWERTFNNNPGKNKSISGPNGPWKAALLSGPPGIGKTTTATLVARESGRDVLELNASDVRSKKSLSEALGDVTGSQVLTFGSNNAGAKKKNSNSQSQKRCIIMDEVDGMGAGDRSGMSELIQMIKKSKVPIICICNDRSSPKMKTLTQYCLDLRYRRPTKMVIAKRAVDIGQREGMIVEINAAEAMAESCGNDIRQVLNSLQMWSCNNKSCSSTTTGGRTTTSMTYRDLKDRQYEINKDEILRVSMFDACRTIVEGSRGLGPSADSKAVTSSLIKRTDAFFVDYMMMGLMVHQNYLKVCNGGYNSAKLATGGSGGGALAEINALNQTYEATAAMSDFGMCEESLRGGDQNWSLLPLCSLLAVKVGHHAGGSSGGFLPGYPEFAGWLGKNSSRNKKIRILQEFRRHMNYKVSADSPELRMNYLPIIRLQLEELLFHKDGAKVTNAIELMDEYGLDRDDVFENFDEFVFNSKELKVKKFSDLDSKTKAAFTRAYNTMAHKAQALVSEQGVTKTGRKKNTEGGGGDNTEDGAELDVVDDDKMAAEVESDDDDEDEDVEALKKKFMKKGTAKGASKTNGKKGKK